MPYFRVRVSDGKAESILEEKFENEVRLRDQLPKRGWTIISVEQIAEPTPRPAAPTEEPPPAIRADQIREDGGWAYLPPELAAQHPLYGIGGWTGLLLAMLIVGALLGLWALIQFVPLLRYGDLFIALFVAVLAIEIVSLVTIILLIRKSRAFPIWYFSLAGSSIAMTLLLFALGGGARAADIGNLIGSIIWISYVLMSRRVNVTFRKRVEPEDEWLKQGLAAAAPILAPAPAR
jgi:hypothetical protein